MFSIHNIKNNPPLSLYQENYSTVYFYFQYFYSVSRAKIKQKKCSKNKLFTALLYYFLLLGPFFITLSVKAKMHAHIVNTPTDTPRAPAARASPAIPPLNTK